MVANSMAASHLLRQGKSRAESYDRGQRKRNMAFHLNRSKELSGNTLYWFMPTDHPNGTRNPALERWQFTNTFYTP